MKKIAKNQQKIVIFILAVIAFGLFGYISPAVKAQLEKSNTVCTKVGNANDTDNPCKRSNGNFVFYCQDDPKWAAKCSRTGVSNALPAAGCGPTSAAMIASSLGVTVTPTQMAEIFDQIGARVCGDNLTSVGTFTGSSWLETNGLDVQGVTVDGAGHLNLKQAEDFLGKGYYIITSSHVYPCQGASGCLNPNGTVDHVFVIDKVDIASNSYEVRDPMNCLPSQGYAENPNNMTRTNNFPLLAAWAITTRQR